MQEPFYRLYHDSCVPGCVCICVRMANYHSPGALTCDIVDLLSAALTNA